MIDPLGRAIANAAVALPSGQLGTLATSLQGFEEAGDGARYAALRAIPTPVFRAHAVEILDAWAIAGGSGGAIALAIRAAAASADAMRASSHVDIVWTGPSTPTVPMRSTVAVLIDVINGASHRLLIVSFAAYKIPTVLAAIRAAISRGVDVRVVVDSPIEEGGRLTVDAARPFAQLDLAVFAWPGNRRATNAAMHAKTAVADGRVALVTSANLTDYALERNMELGLLVTGGTIPQRIEAHFDELIRREELQPCEVGRS